MRLDGLVIPLVFIAVLLAAWELACRLLHVPVYILPTPSAVAVALKANAPLLLASAWSTFTMALTALAIASAIACGLALAAGLSRAIEHAFRPLAVALQVPPVVALAA